MDYRAGAAAPIVIVVDDDADVLASLTFAFEIEGFEVQAHGSGEALLGAGDLSHNACLVLDQAMPGISGLALLDQLRQRGHALPAILITTASPSVKRQAADAGVVIVEKPLMCDTLVGKVRELLAG